MKDTILVDIPYASRSSYFDFIAEVNLLTGQNGNLLLFVNNIPYFPESKLWIFCREEETMHQIHDLIETNHLNIDKTRGSSDLIRETQYRRWNIHGIPVEYSTKEEIADFCEKIYLFPERQSK